MNVLFEYFATYRSKHTRYVDCMCIGFQPYVLCNYNTVLIDSAFASFLLLYYRMIH